MESRSTTREKKDSEKTLERSLAAKIRQLGGLSIKLQGNMYAGMPDRLVLLPEGRAVFVELKSEGVRPRKLQLVRHEELRALGFKVFVIDTHEKLTRFLDEQVRLT